MPDQEEPREYTSRGSIPHYDPGSVPQFVTWRIKDSLPASLMATWAKELKDLSESERRLESWRRVEAYLDQAPPSNLLTSSRAGAITQETLLQGDKESYTLLSWVVMPTHVHVVLVPIPGQRLAKVMKYVKGASSHQINKALGTSGSVWHPNYFDRVIRSRSHLEKTMRYVEWNPVKARLCTDPRDWHLSSAHPKFEKFWDRLGSYDGDLDES